LASVFVFPGVTAVNRDQVIFLLVGVAFGLLLGFVIYVQWFDHPTSAPGPEPAGPAASEESAFLEQFESLRQRVDANPEDVVSLVAMGDLLYRQRMWHEAAHVYERALAVRPDDADILTVTGRCYAEAGEDDKALEYLNRARSVVPTHFAALYNIAMIQGLSQGRFDEAEESLKTLEAEHPGAPETAELRAAIVSARGATAGSD
jgi:tetratricopeptide (TPR) repeat protein